MKTFKHIILSVAAALVSLFEPLYVMATNYLARTGMLATLILDNNLIFDGTVSATTGAMTGVAITTAAGSSQVSTNVIDLQNARDIGTGTDGFPPRVLVLVSTAFQSTGAGTLNVMFQGSDTNTAGATWTTYAESGLIALANLTPANKEIFRIDVPAIQPSGGTLPRYLRLSYAVGTAIFSVGSLMSMISLSRNEERAYPPGVVVNN